MSVKGFLIACFGSNSRIPNGVHSTRCPQGERPIGERGAGFVFNSDTGLICGVPVTINTVGYDYLRVFETRVGCLRKAGGNETDQKCDEGEDCFHDKSDCCKFRS